MIYAHLGPLLMNVFKAVSMFNFLVWILDPFASYLAVGLIKSLQVTICSRYVLHIDTYQVDTKLNELLLSGYYSTCESLVPLVQL